MHKLFTKSLFFLAIFTVFASEPIYAQTLTIQNFVSGIYTAGSSIGVPFNINTTGGCIQQDNKFNLYLTDALGNQTLIGSTTGFYATFVNGVIPAGTLPGTYTLVVKSTDPVETSTSSPIFTVAAGAAVTASISGQSLNGSTQAFGLCNGIAGNQFFFTSTSGTPSSTASFYNESTQNNDATVTLAATGSFKAAATNYTIMVQTTNGVSIGTQAYYLINNFVNNSFGATNSNTVCLTGSGGTLAYNLDISSANGIQNNFPGNTYMVTWGDGSSTTYTLCDLKNQSGQIMHTYTTGSCGHIANGVSNVFEVDIQPVSPFCGTVGTRISSDAKVIEAPTNSFTSPATACTGTTVTFTNTSNPGQDPNSATNTCTNPNAEYTWLVDGTPELANASLNQLFTWTFTTNGPHIVELEFQAGSAGICTAAPVTKTICIQNPPQPAFTLPASPTCLTSPVVPTNTSVVDPSCNVSNYIWTVTGPAAVTYANGTSSGSVQPQFVFSQAGVYQVTLGISSASCGTITTLPQTITVDAPPAITLSPNLAICGTNQTLNFSPAAGPTQTTISGTATPQANTYTWAVTGGAFSFSGGTTANSQYPQIAFTDFAPYTISVTEQNSCGTLTKSQTITFQQAPTVSIMASSNAICPGSAVTLTGTISGAYNSFQWMGSGVFSAPGSLTTTYTPSAAEMSAGSASVILDVKTALTGLCADIQQHITINIFPVNTITSASTAQICTGSGVNYAITSTVPGSTFNWTATLASGTAAGFSNGSGSSINDILTNTNTGNAVVTYTITPQANGCTGTPFTLNVTVKPLPTVAATPANSSICSGSAANINLTGSIAGITYAWTSTVTTGNITGNTQRTAPAGVTAINDALTNSGTTAGTVQYTITPYNGSCPGTPVITTITVQPSPVTSVPGANNEVCNAVTYQLNGNTPPAGAGLWTVSPAAGVTFDNPALPNAAASGLVPGTTYTFTWTITIPGCQSSSNSLKLIDDAPSVGGTTAGAVTVCSGSNNGDITLSGQVGNIVRWESSTDNGATWQTIGNNSTSQQYFNLTQTTQYRAVVTNGSCSLAYSSVTVITVNQPPVTANAGTNQEVCNVTSYQLNGNSPAPGTGQWTVTSGPAGVTFNDATQPNATASGLIPGSTYTFTWTIAAAAPCSPSVSSVIITDDLPSAGGTTAGAATVCAGNNSGAITLSGQVGNIISWQSSIDNGATWQTIANTGTPLQYANLTQTTWYRAVITNGACSLAYSSVTVITVNPPVPVANAGTNQVVCNVTSYQLQGNNPAPGTGLWTITSGPAGVTFNDATQPNAIASGLIPGNSYTFTWTITTGAPCAPSSGSVTITDDAPSAGGITSANATVCAGSNSGIITLFGQIGNITRWESSIDNGATWQPITNNGTLQQYVNLTQTTQYRAVVTNGSCSFAYSSVTTITVNLPAPIANAGSNQEVCNVTSYQLQGNSPAPATGLWTVTSGPAGVTFNDATQPDAIASGLIPGSIYIFTWTITPSAPCSPSSSGVTITNDLPSAGGVTAGAATVCAGSNSGTITLSGQVGNTLSWQSSTDNGVTWQTIANTGTSQQYSNLIATTQYRTVVQNGVCSIQPSTITTITVNQPVMQANAGGDQNLCGATSATLQGNNPSPFTGTWTQTSGPAVTIASPNNFQTQVTGLVPGNNYSFLWTINGQAPCVNSSDPLQINDGNDVIASFTADKTDGCGSYIVNFTNTSTSLTGTSFLWNFGDGSAPSTDINPSHTFAPRTDGKDTVYTVSLSIVNNCTSRAPFTLKVTVRPQTPVAYITPVQLQGCSPFTLAVDNLSPGNNLSYTYYLYDGATLVQQITVTDKSEVKFNPITTFATKQYTLYMVATGFCGATGQSNMIPITVSGSNIIAQMFIENATSSGCVPLTVNFINNSIGGDTYFYTIYDVNHNIVGKAQGGTAPLPYTFSTTGTFYVTITGVNSCSTVESTPPIRIDIYPVPSPQFTADVTTGCKNITVNFTNQTPDDVNTQATSLLYDWDFGDGSPHAFTFTPPPHNYNFKNSPFTVTLTATNPVTNCSNIVTKAAYINVTAPPFTAFTESPDSVINIPNYHFSFIDETSGNPVSWIWTFGDGSLSTSQNPGHTYPDTGVYKVTLTTISKAGCDSTIVHNVRITGVPGQLFFPNAFEPASQTLELQTFKAKGSGIKEWHLQIFNNYAQLIWETTKLDEKGAPVDGWDGTFKGAPMPQGVYVWEASATFINGTQWKGNTIGNSLPKRTGVIHLIR